ncbi:MAG TPA: class I SAM-dependent methyltransferase [Actinobacteria bacterium]|nr:class I SAM-dependent methyltransferase [Actinomycetota bacterium]
MIPTPEIPPEVEILPGVELDELWERYQLFEPLHFDQDLLVPMSEAELGRVVAALGPRPGMRILDIACGHGTLLLRIAERHAVEAVGIDESPWAVTRAAERGRRAPLRGRVRWIIGHGIDAPEGPFDLVACIGASWIWHGFRGTVEAMARRLRPGGRIAVGDLRLREGAPQPEEGRVLTRAEQLEILRAAGLEPLGEIVAAPASWFRYEQAVLASAEAYALAAPGHPIRDRRAFAREWIAELERDRSRLTWSVWVARHPGGRS